MAEDDSVVGCDEKLTLTVAWLLVSALPAVPLFVLGVDMRASGGCDASTFLLPLMWCVTAGLTSMLYARALGRVEAIDVPPASVRALHHLPPACARFVEEARSIGADLCDLDAALKRTWELTTAVERSPPNERALLERCGATLEGVHELLRLHAGGRARSKAESQLRARLETLLTRFEDALAEPEVTAYR